MATVMVHQPLYFPPTWWCARALACDVVVLFDTAQFARRHNNAAGRGATWQNCCEIATATGTQNLTVPVASHGLRPIRETLIADSRYRSKHRHILEANYRRAPHYTSTGPEVAGVIAQKVTTLGQLTVQATHWALRRVGYTGLIVCASELDVDPNARATDAVIELVHAVDGQLYLAGGTSMRNYLDLDRFAAAGIEVQPHHYEAVAYPQGNDGPFRPNLSVIDLLMHVGPGSAATEILAPTGRH